VHVNDKHPFDEIGSLRVNIWRHVELARLDLAQKVWHMLVVEREFPGDEREEDDADAPYVCLRAFVTLTSNDFGTGVVRGTTTCLELREGRLESGHAPVSDLYQFIIDAMDEDVLGFEVTMGNGESVAVRETVDDLLEIGQSFEGREATAIDNEVKKFPALNPFQDQEAVDANK